MSQLRCIGFRGCGVVRPVLRAAPSGSRPSRSPRDRRNREKATAADGAAEATERLMPFWPCPVCGGKNLIQLDSCATCGTPFAQVMRVPDERARDRAARRGDPFVDLPGLGHRAVGRGLDGLRARRAVRRHRSGSARRSRWRPPDPERSWPRSSCSSSPGSASTRCPRWRPTGCAQGGDLLVETKVLMWALVGVVFVGVGLLVFGAVSAAHR